MEDMPRPRPPHVHRETTRHGRSVWYFRREGGKRIRLPDKLGSPEFEAAYLAAMTGEAPLPSKPKIGPSTLAWLIERYKDSQAWASLAPGTQRQRSPILLKLVKDAGDKPYARIDKGVIGFGIDRRKAKPFAAHTWLKAVRGLFQ